jgi:hypothetical protein
MKTSTIVKLSAAVFLCILFLALIGRKSRENFEHFQNAQRQVYGNQNADPNDRYDTMHQGYEINYENDNHLSNLENYRPTPNEPNVFCTISEKTDEQRQDAISREADEAKRQLRAYLNREMKKQNSVKASSAPNLDTCQLLQFPAILKTN